MNITWTAEQTATFLQMAEAGCTAPRIRDALGFSLSAIHGKARRLKVSLAGKKPPTKPRAVRSSYQDHIDGSAVTHSWAEHTRRNLTWHYGEKRVAEIGRGNDYKTNTDLAAWNQIGRRSAA